MMKKLLTFSLLFTLCCGAAGAAEKAPAAEKGGKNPVVVVETSMGNIKIELFQDKAPISTKNFLEYAGEKYYDGTVFHRIIPNFMIQGGGLTAEMKPKPGNKAPIKNEATNGLKNTRGTVAMARTMIPDSATSQFFINVVDNVFLDNRDTSVQGYGYAVFGKVIDGMDVADKIAAVKTGVVKGFRDAPLEPVTIKSVKVLK